MDVSAGRFLFLIYNLELNNIFGIGGRGTTLACELTMSERAIALAVTLEAFLLMIFAALRVIAV